MLVKPAGYFGGGSFTGWLAGKIVKGLASG